MVVLNGKTVDLADLFGGEYWTHEGMIAEAQVNISRKDAKIAKAQRRVKDSDAPEACDPPLREKI